MKKTQKQKLSLGKITKKITFQTTKAFTLVELIVVVTILAILATIGFVSYSSYLTGVRDTNRLAQLVSIHDGLALYSTKNELPVPDENIEVKVNVATTDYSIGFQGYAGSNTLETIDFTKGGQDPRDGQYFSYMLTKNRKSFQLMAFLEEEQSLQSRIIGGVAAVDYSGRIPTVYGDTIGILTNEENTPVQEVVSGEILLNGTGINYVAHMADDENRTGNGSDILYGAYLEIAGKSNTSCKNILSKHPYIFGTDGAYWVDVGQESLKLPCDMTTEGGGWTIVAHATDVDIEKYDSRGNGSWSTGDSLINYVSPIETFKFSDSTINYIRADGDYMLEGSNTSNGGAVSTYFTPGSCVYDHDTIVSGACESMFNDAAFTNTSGISTTDSTNSGKGIAVWANGIIMNYTASTVACFQDISGGCVNQGQDMSIKLFVR